MTFTARFGDDGIKSSLFNAAALQIHNNIFPLQVLPLHLQNTNLFPLALNRPTDKQGGSDMQGNKILQNFPALSVLHLF